MISPNELTYITDHAYVPEHLPHYVTAISRTEPFLLGNFVAHITGTHLVFVGYPLDETFEEAQLLKALEQAKSEFKPESIAIIAPARPGMLNGYTTSASDSYYRLELSGLRIPQKTRNMLTRARQEVNVMVGKFSREHKNLIEDFLRHHRLDEATKFIFQRVKEYAACATALIFEARNARGDLVAFDIAEFGARKYAFYMFNFRSRKHTIPGVSDLLLDHIIQHATVNGKLYFNMGLGINPGITFFKKKWGAIPFLAYIVGEQESKRRASWAEMFDQLSGL